MNVFISYAREDIADLHELLKHLKTLERDGLCAFWYDEALRAGDPWEEKLDERLKTSNVVLALLSADFLASRYCYEVEARYALRAKHVRVIPVVLRSCDWKNTPFGSLNALPREGIPIANYEQPDDAFLEIAEELRRIATSESSSLLRAQQRDDESTEAEERAYLEWVKTEMMGSLRLWHATPIVPIEAHAKRKRWRWFRHNPEDYVRNPALADIELSARSGFGTRVRIKNLVRELRKFSKIVVLGDPGAGKSVCMRQLAYDLAAIEGARREKPRTIPLYLDMGTYEHVAAEGDPLPILEFLKAYHLGLDPIRKAGPDHPVHPVMKACSSLLRQGRLTCIFDALDEMPQGSYRERYDALTTFMKGWESFGNRFIFSCRTLDYDPSFPVDEVLIEPFKRQRIEEFLETHVPVPEVAKLLIQRVNEDESLLEMVSNPFHLQALAYVNVEMSSEGGEVTVRVPGTRGELVRVFAEELLAREVTRRFQGVDAVRLRSFLARIAFALQQRREGGTSTPIRALDPVLGDYPDAPKLFWFSQRARLLGKRGQAADELADIPPPNPKLPETVEFVHHRLQEYFAAVALAEEIASFQVPAAAPSALEDARFADIDTYFDDIWWHETVVMAVGIVDDPEPIVSRMLRATPEVKAWSRAVLAGAAWKQVSEDAE